MSEDKVPTGAVPIEEKPDSHSSSGTLAASAARFYQVRSRIYTALLVFTVVIGLPIVSIPGLRYRLAERTLALRQAMYGPVPKLTAVKIGESKAPFPQEYESLSALEIPLLKPAPIPSSFPPPTQTSPLVSKKIIQAGKERAAAEEPTEIGDATSASEVEQPQAETRLQFQQGSVEKEAYDLLLSENQPVRDMVSGKNPVLQFKSWSAAKTQDDGAYLVDLAFMGLPDNQEEHFIWLVNLATKQITPMSFNARSLPK